jgi:hypothetical protein
MSFREDLVTAITADSSVNLWATGGMKYNNLPTNFDITKNWLVFGFTEDGGIDTFANKNIVENYTLDIQLVSSNKDSINDIYTILNTHLINYKEDDLEFILVNADLDFDTEKAVNFKTIKYNIIY